MAVQPQQVAQRCGGERPRLWTGQLHSTPYTWSPVVGPLLPEAPWGCLYCPNRSLPLRGPGASARPPRMPAWVPQFDGAENLLWPHQTIQAVLGYEYFIGPCKHARLHLQLGDDGQKEGANTSSLHKSLPVLLQGQVGAPGGHSGSRTPACDIPQGAAAFEVREGHTRTGQAARRPVSSPQLGCSAQPILPRWLWSLLCRRCRQCSGLCQL